MKSEIVIKQGQAKVVLYAESEFEKDLIEKIVDSKFKYKTETTVKTECRYHTHSEHRIEISLKETDK
jgi:hypothetical protein